MLNPYVPQETAVVREPFLQRVHQVQIGAEREAGRARCRRTAQLLVRQIHFAILDKYILHFRNKYILPFESRKSLIEAGGARSRAARRHLSFLWQIRWSQTKPFSAQPPLVWTSIHGNTHGNAIE